MATPQRQAVLTVVFGQAIDGLHDTFLSFAQNPFLKLHAFVIGDALPQKRHPEITYHLKPYDSSFGTMFRDSQIRRWAFVDEVDADSVLVVDGRDVLCLQPLPELPDLLRGASCAACVEHLCGRYLASGYCPNYVNSGVTLWNVEKTKTMRELIVARGRGCFRDDQDVLNEVLSAHYDDFRILPGQFNYRAYVSKRQRGWPTVHSLDGVMIYHNSSCIAEAKRLLPVKRHASLPTVEHEVFPDNRFKQLMVRVRKRLSPYIVK